MVHVIIFVNGEKDTDGDRSIIPRIGETIVLDCGNMVKVVELNHDWGDDGYVQLNCEQVKEDDSEQVKEE